MKRMLAAVLLFALLISCRAWSTVSPQVDVQVSLPTVKADVRPIDKDPTPIPQSVQPPIEQPPPTATAAPPLSGAVQLGDPAGCLLAQSQVDLKDSTQMLEYADQLLPLNRSLMQRVFPGSWNSYSHKYLYDQNEAISLDVSDVQNEYILQRMLNTLHVAGFVAWLRDSSKREQGVHILALPLLKSGWSQGEWAPYIKAYWQSPQSTPEGDSLVRPALKLPPCAWMVTGGFAPPVDAGWWSQNQTGWPDYASVAQAYLASNNTESNAVAQKIDWLGSQLEGANTMCGPLSWSILHDAGAFMPGLGAWLEGSKTFWLAKPTTNGRPWSIFPKGSYTVYHFKEPLNQFDFQTWPLYPGDFLYTYSQKDGFDHMLVVTEVQPDGNIYTVTNLVNDSGKEVTIERALLVNIHDPKSGLINNEWSDRVEGRTGQAGFDVFRWDWMEKDILKEPVTYSVMPGDTLGLISIRWKTPADFIAQYNQLTPDISLAVGQKIIIPPNENHP